MKGPESGGLQEQIGREREKIAKHHADSLVLRGGEITKEQYYALMAVSDIWVLTPLRQGYTLVRFGTG